MCEVHGEECRLTHCSRLVRQTRLRLRQADRPLLSTTSASRLLLHLLLLSHPRRLLLHRRPVMTTSHKPTYHPAIGRIHAGGWRFDAKRAQFHSRDMARQMELKVRMDLKPQTNDREALKQALFESERKHKQGIKDGQTKGDSEAKAQAEREQQKWSTLTSERARLTFRVSSLFVVRLRSSQSALVRASSTMMSR